MKFKFLNILILLLVLPYWMGCAQKSSKTIAKSNANVKVNSVISTANDKTSNDPYDSILSNDIFTPPDMRKVNDTPPPTIPVVEAKIEPQKLTITGIVFDGKQYLVSVENLETGDQHYLKPGDSLARYPIVTVDFDTVKVQDKKKLLAFGIGDEIPLPGTRSEASDVSSMAVDTTLLAKDTTETNTLSSAPASVQAAGDSMEEILRQRRLKQEEELK